MNSSWSLGELVEVRTYVRKDGEFWDPFAISKVEICKPDGTVASTIASPFLITHPSTGVYQVTYQTTLDMPTGDWTTKWYIHFTGYDACDTIAESKFTLRSGTFEASSDAAYPLSFTFAVLNDTFQRDSKMFMRINVNEIYERLWSIKNAKIRVQRYVNKYQILTIQDWTAADWLNQEMVAIFDCTGLPIGENYFAQVQLDLSNGEVVLSPRFKVRVVDFVNQNAW